MALTERLALLVDTRVEGAVRDIKSLAKEAGKTDDSAKKLEARGAAIGKAWKVGVGFAAGAALIKMTQLAGESIQAASNLSETTNKVGVVFDDQAAKILAFGETAATALGQSKEQALGAAAVFGQFFDAAGLAGGAAADMSIRMVQLASDMASFNNADPSEVLENLRSGLAGETEPLRKFGVFLNEAAVASKAAELGLTGVNGKLTDGEKIQARYALILDQTVKAQGDFARTADGLANQQRIATAEMENAKAELGQGLLPAQLAVTRAFVDMAPTITVVAREVGELVEGFTELPGPMQAIIGATTVMGGGFLLLAPRINETKKALLDLGIMSEETAGKMTKSQLAMRAGAGILGATALALNDLDQSADHATRTLGEFANIGGGALLGFAAGGPIGAAIGGGVAAIGALVGAISKGDDAARKAAQGADVYRTTLDQLTGSITGATAAMVAKRLEEQGVLEDAQKLGISTTMLVDAILGQGNAAQVLSDQLDALRGKYSGISGDGVTFQGILDGQTTNLLGAAQAAGEAESKYGGLLPVLQRVQGAFGVESSAINQSTEAQKRVVAAAGETTSATDDLGAAMGAAGKKTDQLTDRQKKMAAQLKASREAAHGTAEEFFGLGDSLDDNKVSLAGWLKEMEKSADALINFERNAKKAAKNGLRDGLIRELEAAGPAGALRMKQLANATDTEIDRANKAWARGQQAIRDWVDFKVPPKKVGVDIDTDSARREFEGFVASIDGRRVTLGLGLHAPEARAAGGPVRGGEPYVVGENGPELFVPGSAGRIVAHHDLARSTGGGGSWMRATGEVETFARTVGKASTITEKHARKLLESAQGVRDGWHDTVRDLKEQKRDVARGFASSFGQTVFGSDATNIQDILKMRGSQASDALALNQAIAALIKKGVSEDVLRELANGGQGGFDQIKALAGADKAQLAEFNKLTAFANGQLTAAGNLVGGSLLNDDIAVSQHAEKLASAIAHELKVALDVKDKNTIIHFHLGAKEVQQSLLELKRKNGGNLGLS